MNLYDWVKDALKDGVELWSDDKLVTNAQGVTIKRDTRRLREICLGVISSNTAEEWYRICRLNAPVGTVITPYIDVWEDLFNDTTALVRNELTKCLLKERAAKSAQTLLGILERRDKPHWSKEQKETKVSATTADGAAMNVTFSIME